MALNYLLLGKKIQSLRAERKISQLKFSEMIEKSPTFVSRMERGIKHPSLETLVLISSLLDVSLDSLLSESIDLPQAKGNVIKNDLLGNCNAYERFILQECVKELKRILQDGEKIRDWTNKV